MLQTQVLASGIVIRQDIEAAARLPIFSSGNEDFPFWTNGGTVLLVQYQGRIFGITCRHVRGNDAHAASWGSLFIPLQKSSNQCVGIRACYSASQAWGHALGSDIQDIAILTFAGHVDAQTFGGSVYILDANTICRSEADDRLVVHGTLKEKTSITPKELKTTYCHLECVDRGKPLSDIALRTAFAELDGPLSFDTVTGLSGGPIYNIKKRALCGVAVRGGLTGSSFTLHYIDANHVMKLVQSVRAGIAEVRYRADDEAFVVRR